MEENMMGNDEWLDPDPDFQPDNYYKSARLSELAGNPAVLVDGSSPRPPWLSSLETAKFQHWLKYSHWDLDQATALFLGVSPYQFDWSIVSAHLAEDEYAQSCHRFRQSARHDLFIDAELKSPAQVLAWAKLKNFTFPYELTPLKESSVGDNSILKSLGDEWGAVSTLRKRSIFRLLLALLMDGYGIDPISDNVRGMKKISDLMEVISFGADVGPALRYDTIRRIIKEAVDVTELSAANVKQALQQRPKADER